MVASFFASVAYLWYIYYLVAYAVCLRRIYDSAVESNDSRYGFMPQLGTMVEYRHAK